jgi:hypothetical protein
MPRKCTLLLGMALAAPFISLAGVVRAQEWIEYKNLEFGFAVNFPVQPRISETEYTSPIGEVLSAHLFSVEEGTNRYSITVVDFSAHRGEEHVAVGHATDAMRERGEVLFEIYTDLDEIYGPQFMIIEPDGREMMSTIVFYDDRLYIVEGSVAPGAAAPAQFQQSMMLLNQDGSRPNSAGENEDRLARQRAFEEQRLRALENTGE